MIAVFTALLSVHIWADFALQFEELYRLKTRYLKGHLLHVLLHAGLGLAVLAPILYSPAAWLLVLGINAIHLIQDLYKYRHLNDKKILFASFTIDQVLHGTTVAGASLLFAFLRPAETAALAEAYGGGALKGMAALSLWVLLVFGAAYWWHAFRLSHLSNTRPDHGITSFEMWWGLTEKSLVFAVVLLASPAWWPAAGMGALARLASPRMRRIEDGCFNLVAAYSIGFWARKVVGL